MKVTYAHEYFTSVNIDSPNAMFISTVVTKHFFLLFTHINSTIAPVGH